MSWLQDVATRHGGGVVVAQLVLRLLALADALSDVALMAASEDRPDISKVSDGVVLSQEGLNLFVSGLIDAFDGSKRIIMTQILVALHVRSVDVGALGIHDVRWRVQVLERVYSAGLVECDLRARGRRCELPRGIGLVGVLILREDVS